jgi:hypothetical protein
MKKTVLTFGLISGAVISGMMLLMMPFHDAIGFEIGGLIVGYATMLLGFLLIYFGVRSYRDKVGGGTVRFGRAFAVGALIGLVSSLCYVATWEVVYFKFMPDFMDKYGAHVIEKARASGENEAAIAKRRQEMAEFAEMYRNPAFNAAVTLVEPLPVALLVALITAGVLSRRPRAAGAAGASRGAAAPLSPES